MGVLSHIMYKFTVLPPTFANNECGSIFFVCLLSSQVQAASTIAQTHTSTLNSRWYGDGASILRTAPTTWHTHVSGPGGLNVRFFEVTCGRLQSQPGRFVRGHQGREMTTGKPIDLCTQSCRVRASMSPVWVSPLITPDQQQRQRPKRVSPGRAFGFWGRLREPASDQPLANTRVRRPAVASVTVQQGRGRTSWWFRLSQAAICSPCLS